jgi:hypothetical protein
MNWLSRLLRPGRQASPSGRSSYPRPAQNSKEPQVLLPLSEYKRLAEKQNGIFWTLAEEFHQHLYNEGAPPHELFIVYAEDDGHVHQVKYGLSQHIVRKPGEAA